MGRYNILMNEPDERLDYYLSIGVVELSGVSEDGEFIYSVNEEMAREFAPELWDAHTKHIDKALIELYKKGFMKVSYDENLQADISLSPEGVKAAKELGIIQIDTDNIPND